MQPESDPSRGYLAKRTNKFQTPVLAVGNLRFPWGMHQPQIQECQSIIWQIFACKLHKNERNWTERGLYISSTPLDLSLFRCHATNSLGKNTIVMKPLSLHLLFYHMCIMHDIGVFPKWSRTFSQFSKFREFDKSPKYKLESIQRYCLLPVTCLLCDRTLVSYTRGCRFE